MLMRTKNPDLVSYSLELGQHVLAGRSEAGRKQSGQFFTPAPVARFMARQLGPIRSGDRILDPAIGSGVLACAVIERVISEGRPLEIWLDGYEIDRELSQTARKVLEVAAEYAALQGIVIHGRVTEADFILANLPASQPYLFLAESSPHPHPDALYNHIIANPPYFKLNSNDSRVRANQGQLKGHTNIYTLFIASAVKKLVPQGRACFIVPRSFCSGVYFSAFRQELMQEALPVAVHLFESRQETFKSDTVLQENIIFSFRRREVCSTKVPPETCLTISTSKGGLELSNDTPHRRKVALAQFLKQRHGALFFRLPTGELDEQIVEMVDSWTGSLGQYGLEVSTGPVVAFRAQTWLTDIESVFAKQAIPLLWMQNVKAQQVEWPTNNGNKAQGIVLGKETEPLLLPAANYVLLRRFSAKEEPRRLIAAPFLANQFSYAWIGLENHLNYIYKKQGGLETEEAVGLSTLLNSALIDRYFRIVNGNTQVNAAELRVLPLPPLEIIKQIGREVLGGGKSNGPVDIETTVFSALREANYLPSDFPLIRETRITMGKIQEAQEILKALGLPPAQQNEISALTLLVLAQLSEETPWTEAKRQSLRVHDMLTEIKARYGREYAENTRETIRRQVLHQFEQAGLVFRNPDDPTLATNSPRTHYALSDAAIRTIRYYGSAEWQEYISAFPDFVTFKSFLTEIAWETEVWLAEIPDHLIHFNGDRFLGPHQQD